MPKRSLETIRTALGKRGYRATRQRQAIVAELAACRRYLTAAELHERLARRAKIGLATIYRTLEVLKAIGAASGAPQPRGKIAYLFCPTGHHHHAICTRCGRVDDVPCRSMAPFKEVLRRQLHFTVAQHRLEFFGVCEKCSWD